MRWAHSVRTPMLPTDPADGMGVDRTIVHHMVRDVDQIQDTQDFSGLPNEDQIFNQKGLRFRLYLLAMIIDMIVVLSSFAAASLIRFGSYLPSGLFALVASTTAVYLLGAFSWGAYSLDALTNVKTGTRRSLTALFYTFALLFLIFFFLKVDPEVSRVMTILSFVIAATVLVMARSFFSSWMNRRYSARLVRRVFIQDIDQPLNEHRLHGEEWVVAACPEPSRADMQMEFARLIYGADRVIVSCSREKAARWADALRWSGVQSELLFPENDQISPIGVATYNNALTLVIACGPLSFGQRFAKRTLDLIVASVLLVVTAPIWILAAIAVKLDSKGPIIFRQERVGEGNVPFEIYKFRTFAAEATDADGDVSVSRVDTRVTRVGRFLRRSSIDEIPQLFNVLIGNMSMVGPRPHALGSKAENKLFWEIDATYWHRHALKPGITGLAQVRGFRGATDLESHLQDRVRADLEYIKDWSIPRDLLIMLQTALVLIHPNAY